MGRLLEAVQGLDELADVVGMITIDEAGGLVAVDELRQLIVQERVLHVELMDWPLPRGR